VDRYQREWQPTNLATRAEELASNTFGTADTRVLLSVMGRDDPKHDFDTDRSSLLLMGQRELANVFVSMHRLFSIGGVVHRDLWPDNLYWNGATAFAGSYGSSGRGRIDQCCQGLPTLIDLPIHLRPFFNLWALEFCLRTQYSLVLLPAIPPVRIFRRVTDLKEVRDFMMPIGYRAAFNELDRIAGDSAKQFETSATRRHLVITSLLNETRGQGLLAPLNLWPRRTRTPELCKAIDSIMRSERCPSFLKVDSRTNDDDFYHQTYYSFDKYRTYVINDLLRQASGAHCNWGLLSIEVNSLRTVEDEPFQVIKSHWTQHEIPCKKQDNAMFFVHLHDQNQVGHLTTAVLTGTKSIPTAEYFESNGSAAWLEAVSTIVRNSISKTAELADHVFIEPQFVCPNVGPQQISGLGDCANWASLFAYLHLTCSTVPSRIFVSDLIARGKTFLRQLMRNWTCFMWRYAIHTRIKDIIDITLDLSSGEETHRIGTNTITSELIMGNHQKANDLAQAAQRIRSWFSDLIADHSFEPIRVSIEQLSQRLRFDVDLLLSDALIKEAVRLERSKASNADLEHLKKELDILHEVPLTDIKLEWRVAFMRLLIRDTRRLLPPFDSDFLLGRLFELEGARLPQTLIEWTTRTLIHADSVKDAPYQLRRLDVGTADINQDIREADAKLDAVVAYLSKQRLSYDHLIRLRTAPKADGVDKLYPVYVNTLFDLIQYPFLKLEPGSVRSLVRNVLNQIP
jgi:hypothetical protein